MVGDAPTNTEFCLGLSSWARAAGPGGPVSITGSPSECRFSLDRRWCCKNRSALLT